MPAKTLSQAQRGRLFEELERNIGLAYSSYNHLGKVVQAMRALGITGYDGGYNRADLEWRHAYIGQTHYDRLCTVRFSSITNAVSGVANWAGGGEHPGLPGLDPDFPGITFTLWSLDGLRTLSTCIPVIADTTICDTSGIQASFTLPEALPKDSCTVVSNRLKTRGSRLPTAHKITQYADGLFKAFRDHGYGGVWTLLDLAWAETFSQPNQFIRGPLELQEIRRRYSVLEGKDVKILTELDAFYGVWKDLIDPTGEAIAVLLEFNNQEFCGLREIKYREIVEIQAYPLQNQLLLV